MNTTTENLTMQVDEILQTVYNDAIVEQQIEEEQQQELCMICYTSELSAEPCVTLSCGHIFHTNCVNQLLQHKWSTIRISFAFL